MTATHSEPVETETEQTEITEFTAESADDVEVGDTITLRDPYNGSGNYEGEVVEVRADENVVVAENAFGSGMRRKRIEFKADGEAKPDGTCFTFDVEVEGERAVEAEDEDDTPYGARSFLFAEDDETDADLTFEVVAIWTNKYNDERIAVETPAPWDTPEDMTASNDVIKSLPWSDEDAEGYEGHTDLDEGVHYTFDDDVYGTPAEAADAWALDRHGAEELRRLAAEAGYGWDASAAFDEVEGDVDEDELDDAVAFVREGDHVEVRYAKKNGNGIAARSGEVTAARGADERRDGAGLAIREDDGKTKSVRRDDDGVPSVYSSGYYPYMGRVVSVSVEPRS